MILDFLRTMILSIVSFFKRDPVLVSEVVACDRMNICKTCVYLKGSNIINYKCKLCKCYLNYKTKFSASECPAGIGKNKKYKLITRIFILFP